MPTAGFGSVKRDYQRPAKNRLLIRVVQIAGRRTEMREDVSGSRVSYEYGKMGELLRMASIPEESRAGVWMERDYDAALRETERRFSTYFSINRSAS